MIQATQSTVGFWKTVRILLGTARRRSWGRRRRQKEILAQRTGKQSSTDVSVFGFAITVLFMAFINAGAGYVLVTAVDAAQRLSVEMNGKIVVDSWFYNQAAGWQDVQAWRLHDPGRIRPPAEPQYHREAWTLARLAGGSREDIEQGLRDAVRLHGVNDLVSYPAAAHGLKVLARTGPVPMMFGSLILIWWGVLLVFQSEGLELDIQRRRHPLWEWIFSHPVPSGAVFLAEILTPIAANPAYWTSPLFAGVVYGYVYGVPFGLLAVFVIGIPLTVAAASLGKALEIAAILRFSARVRGAVVGLMSWIGYSTLMLFLVGMFVVADFIRIAGKFVFPIANFPWPFLRLFLGGPWNYRTPHTSGPAGFSFLVGMLCCWLASALVTGCGVVFTLWGAQRGLAGVTTDIAPARSRSGSARFGSEPLYRKELLWFLRDRSAIVQTILIPLTVAGFQLFNLRGILSKANGEWNYLCGAAILFGTYFLWILGPKSLASEGQSLWIALTWPRGLESLLKAKAWLWSLISSGIVLLILLWAAFLFPPQIPKIALLAVGWWFFGRSMAEKSVTLVVVTSSSGEQQPVPKGRRSGAQLGMLTFALGVITQQWHLAVIGIVFSWITAAAMWQNFRARLPYLYDPWSERLPPAPTLMHAMVAISLLIECGAVFISLAVAFVPRQDLAIAKAMAYAVAATLVFLGTSKFLNGRGVTPNYLWSWTNGPLPTPLQERSLDEYLAEPQRSFAERYGFTGGDLLQALLIAVAIGLALGGLAHVYLAVLRHIPTVADLLGRSDQAFNDIPGLRLSYAIMAVGFAPVAEEYLFRGLLFRALDREWGGWRAVLGAAAFFAVYHPLLSWLPVFCLGVVNCLLFKRTRRLLPCILLHMVYNATVLMR